MILFTLIKQKYFSYSQESEAVAQPRLFQCSNASGRFWVEGIHKYDQDVSIDISESNIMSRTSSYISGI